MKKYFERFLKLVMLFVVTLSATTVVSAETAPSKLTMTYYNKASTPVSFPATFHVKKTTGGKYAYCTYYSKRPPVTSVSYTRGNQVSDNGINYILKQSYNASNDDSFFIYQTALWTYMIDKGIMPGAYYDLTVFRSTVNNSSSSTATQIRNLVSNAKKASANDTSAPTIKLSTNGVSFNYNSSNGTYVSTPITVTSSTGKYTVLLSGAPTGSKASISGNKVTVTVPQNKMTSLSTKITITVSNSKDVYTSYYYSPSNSAYQTMATTFKETKTAKASGTLVINKTVSVDVIKTDEGGVALSGATMQVVNSKGVAVDTWTTDGNKHTVSGLSEGVYTVKETAAPKGYVLSGETIKFTVNSDGTIVNSNNQSLKLIQFKNTKTSVTISKQDITNSKELPGASLVIKDTTGKEIAKWTSSSKPYVIKGLAAGTYTLTETVAPNGYVLSTETITFKLDNNGKLYDASGKNVSSIVMYNKPVEKKICINENGKYYGKDGSVVSEEQYKSDCLKICKNENGKYYGKDGSIVSEEQYKNDCLKICKNENDKYYGKDGSVVSEEQYKNDCLKICKNENGKYYGKDGSVVSEEQYKSDCLKICKNENGKYYGKDGSVVSEEQYKSDCTVTHTAIISKKDVTNGQELPGATLVVKDYDGNVIETWVSTNESHVIQNLNPGIYTLTETIAPAGYVLSSETITFTIKEDGTSTSVVMYNSPDSKDVPVEPVNPVSNVEVPVESTSSFKSIVTSVVGVAIATVGATMLYITSKRRKKD